MTDVEQAEHHASASHDGGLVERRRPGRVEYTNPAQIALMRSIWIEAADIDGKPLDERISLEPATYLEPADDLGAAKGILLGIITGALIWAALIFAALWFVAS